MKTSTTPTEQQKEQLLATEQLNQMMGELAHWLLLWGYKWKDGQEALSIGYARAAERSLKRQGRKLSQPNIYLHSGIWPQKYREIRDAQNETESKTNQNLLSYLVHCWKTTPPYGRKGNPKALSIRSDVGKDFRSLCAEAIPGYSYKSVLSELDACGMVRIGKDKISLTNKHLLPSKLSFDGFMAMLRPLQRLLATMNHNLTVDDHSDGSQYSQIFERGYLSTGPISAERELWKKLTAIYQRTLAEVKTVIDSHETLDGEAERTFFASMYLNIEPPLQGDIDDET